MQFSEEVKATLGSFDWCKNRNDDTKIDHKPFVWYNKIEVLIG